MEESTARDDTVTLKNVPRGKEFKRLNSEREEKMTLNELIEKLQSVNSYESIGSAAVFDTWINDSIFRGWHTYDNLYGFIWGLYSLSFITKDEKESLLLDLMQTVKK